MLHLFSIQKPKGPNLTLTKNKSRSTWGHHLNKLGSTQSHNAIYQVSRQSTQGFRRRRIVKVFTIYGHCGHPGQETWTIWTNFQSTTARMLYMKFDWNWPNDFREVFEKVDDTDAHAWRQITVYTISSLGAFGSGELKRYAIGSK